MAVGIRKQPVPNIDCNITMEELQRLYPQVIPVLNYHRMYCVGCLLAAFHNIHDAAFEHGLDEDQLYKDILSIIAADKSLNR